MKTDPVLLAVRYTAGEPAEAERGRGWRRDVARLSRDIASQACELEALGARCSLMGRRALVADLVERQPLVAQQMRGLFFGFGGGRCGAPSPWSAAFEAELRSHCASWDASRLAHHLRVVAHGFDAWLRPRAGGSVDASRVALANEMRRHPIFVVEVLQRLSGAVVPASQRGAHAFS